MLSREELKNLPRGAIVADIDGDVLIKSGRHHFTVLSSEMDHIGDRYHIGAIDDIVIGEVGGAEERIIRDALSAINGVRERLAGKR